MRKQKANSGNFISFILIVLMIVIFIGLGLFIYTVYEDNKEAIVSKVQEFSIEENQSEEINNDTNVSDQVENPYAKIKSNGASTNSGMTAGGYYYNQLDENAKIVYRALANNIDTLKSGTQNIDLGTQFTDLLEQENGQQVLGDSFQAAWDAFSVDRPDVFYTDTNKMYLHMEGKKTLFSTTYSVYIGKGDNASYLAQGFSSPQEVNNAISQVEVVSNQIISSLSGNTYNQIKQVHDWLVDNIEYDQTLNRANTRNIYGALVEKKVVCEGYARSFKYLMDKIGVPCIIVSGTGTNSEGKTESHAWNYVQLNDNWYAVDLTWDDPVIVGSGRLPKNMKYKYFLKGSSTFNQDHVKDGKMTPNGKEFTYPELSQTDL